MMCRHTYFQVIFLSKGLRGIGHKRRISPQLCVAMRIFRSYFLAKDFGHWSQKKDLSPIMSRHAYFQVIFLSKGLWALATKEGFLPNYGLPYFQVIFVSKELRGICHKRRISPQNVAIRIFMSFFLFCFLFVFFHSFTFTRTNTVSVNTDQRQIQ